MQRHNLKHLHTVRKRLASGRVATYYYRRLTRKPIYGEPGSPEFLQSYIEAGKRKRPIGERTLGDLIQRYRRSRDYASKAPRTQRDYDEHLVFDMLLGTALWPGFLAHLRSIMATMIQKSSIRGRPQ